MINCRQFPNSSGIYKITSPNGLVYIGEAANLRIRCEFYLNPNRIKRQRAIYNSIVRHGVDNHKIEIIEFCAIDNLFERERYWQEFYDSVEHGLNCHYTSTSEKKKMHSSQTREIMSKKASGVNNGFFGKKHTKESLLKISRASSGSNNAAFGKHHNDEYKKKQSISNSKKPLKVIDTKTNEVSFYINSKECAAALGINHALVRASKNKYRAKRRYIVEDLILE